MGQNILFNFISPVTGRILCDPGKVLLGDANGIAVPSDMPDGKLPDLTSKNLWIGNELNRPVETPNIEINNLPNLILNSIWKGDEKNRPIEFVPDYVSGPADAKSVDNHVAVWEGETGRVIRDSKVSLLKLIFSTAVSREYANQAKASALLSAKWAKISVIAALASIGGAIASGVAAHDSGGTGAAGASGKSTLSINSNLNLSGGRIENLAPSPLADYDAVNAKWVWDLLNDNVEIKWEDRR